MYSYTAEAHIYQVGTTTWPDWSMIYWS